MNTGNKSVYGKDPDALNDIINENQSNTTPVKIEKKSFKTKVFCGKNLVYECGPELSGCNIDDSLFFGERRYKIVRRDWTVLSGNVELDIYVKNKGSGSN